MVVQEAFVTQTLKLFLLEDREEDKRVQFSARLNSIKIKNHNIEFSCFFGHKTESNVLI